MEGEVLLYSYQERSRNGANHRLKSPNYRLFWRTFGYIDILSTEMGLWLSRELVRAKIVPGMGRLTLYIQLETLTVVFPNNVGC